MAQRLGAKLAKKIEKCKNSSDSNAVTRGRSVDSLHGSRKSKRSQYFDTVNFDPKRGLKKRKVNEMDAPEAIETSEDVRPRTRSALRKKEATKTIEQSSKKLSKVKDNHKDVSNIDLRDSDISKPNNKRRKVNADGDCHVDNDNSIDVKRKRLDRDFDDSGVETLEPTSTEVVRNKRNSRQTKTKCGTPKNDKNKSTKSRPSTNDSERHSLVKSDDIDCDNTEDEDSDDDDDDDWEEVTAPRKKIESVQVMITDASRGKKTPEEQMMGEFRCAVNRTKILRQKQCHQVHLLCHLAIGLNYNKTCDDPELQALALSHLPIKFLEQSATTWKVETLFSFVTWFHKHFPCHPMTDPGCHDDHRELTNNLKKRFEDKKAENMLEHSLMVVTTLRVLGFNVRLIHSFEPVTSKPSDLLMKPSSSSSPLVFGKTSKKFSSTSKSSKKEKARSAACSRKSSSNSKPRKSDKSGKVNNNNSNKSDLELEGGETTSAADEEGTDNGKFDWWSEVYLPEEKRWIYVNSHRCVADDFGDARNNIKRPFSYVLAWQNEGFVKDLTSRYDPDWLMISCRKRVDPDWWKSTLAFFASNQSENDSEDLTIEDELFKQPLPTSISAYKNHPLYVLTRHLLKFECIYPQTSLVLGHVKDEPVFSRDCVHMLHSKDKWKVEGRVVKEDEEPYKVVKRRPKMWGKKRVPCDENLQLFGKWQTELFVPKPAVGGIVPKNDFGNVEIFKPWMLPPGTLFIEDAMPGLGRVAKKLEIDVAPAMLGWEFHRNVSAPILKGWVVCVEHKEILTAAWEEEQRNIREKELEKKQERVLNNWKKLSRTLLIRERLKEQFSMEYSKGCQKKPMKSRAAAKKQVESKKVANRPVAVAVAVVGDKNSHLVQMDKDGFVGGGFNLSEEETDEDDVDNNDTEK